MKKEQRKKDENELVAKINEKPDIRDQSKVNYKRPIVKDQLKNKPIIKNQ
jgi:hypothetical protein